MKPLDFKLFVLRPSSKINKWIPLNPGRPFAKRCTVLASKVSVARSSSQWEVVDQGSWVPYRWISNQQIPELGSKPRIKLLLFATRGLPGLAFERISAFSQNFSLLGRSSWWNDCQLTGNLNSHQESFFLHDLWKLHVAFMRCGGKIATGKTSFAHRQEYRGTRQDWQLTSRWCTVINIFSASTWLPKTQGTHGVTKSTKSLNHCEAQLPATPVGKGGTYEIPWKWWTILVALVWKISSNTKNIPINCCCCLVVLSDKKWKSTRES